MLDPSKPPEGFYFAKEALQAERERDMATKKALLLVQECMDENENNINEVIAQRNRSISPVDEGEEEEGKGKKNDKALVDSSNPMIQADATRFGRSKSNAAMFTAIDDDESGRKAPEAPSVNSRRNSWLDPLARRSSGMNFFVSSINDVDQDTIGEDDGECVLEEVEADLRESLQENAPDKTRKSWARTSELMNGAALSIRFEQRSGERYTKSNVQVSRSTSPPPFPSSSFIVATPPSLQTIASLPQKPLNAVSSSLPQFRRYVCINES